MPNKLITDFIHDWLFYDSFYLPSFKLLLTYLLIYIISGGNQRDLARAKNQKKQQEMQKKKNASEKSGMSLQERKHR